MDVPSMMGLKRRQISVKETRPTYNEVAARSDSIVILIINMEEHAPFAYAIG